MTWLPDGPCDQWCFYDEYAWDDRHFFGGHYASEYGGDPGDPRGGVGDYECGVDDADHPHNASSVLSSWDIPGSPAANRTYLGDLDGDTVPNADDRCYIDGLDGCTDWPFAGSYALALDRDLDGIVNECDNCPDTPNPPYTPSGRQADSDSDGIGNACDLCITSAGKITDRDDTVLDGVPSAYDGDGDGVGDRCDPCPRHDWNQGRWPLEPGWPSDFLREAASVDPVEIGDGLAADWDEDGDDIGDDCDNCRSVWNPDQVNCNEDDERRWWSPDRREPFRGTGDACDATPCLAECAKLSGQRSESILSTQDECVVAGLCGWYAPEGHWYCDYDCTSGEPAELTVCPVGFADAAAAEDHDAEDHATAADFARTGSAVNQAMRLRTEYRGCPCRLEERADSADPETARHCEEIYCPRNGRSGGSTRWSYATNDHQFSAITGCYCLPGAECPPCEPGPPPQPVFNYRRTYGDDGTLGDPDKTRRALYDPHGAYRDWYRFGGPHDATLTATLIAREEWNYLTDAEQWQWDDESLCTDVHGTPDCRIFPRDVMRDESVWFKPLANLADGYGGYSRDYPQFGNSYIERRSISGDHHRVTTGAPEQFHPIPGSGTPYLPGADDRALNFPGAYSPFVGLLDPFIAIDPKLMFDQQGTLAGGILTAKWDAGTQLYVDLVGTKIGSGAYDLASSSLAVGMAADGKMTAYWLFGGRSADGNAHDGFWAAHRSVQMALDGTMLEAFVLDQVLPGPDAVWPAARWGATLAPSAANIAKPASVDEPPAAAASSPGSTGNTTMPGSKAAPLLLIGGENESGLLADIWIFEASSWRALGQLPGADVGLTDPGVAMTDDGLWLFGGRDASGPSATLWRVDPATGAAERILPISETQPAPRVRPALAVDPETGELLAFGGTSGGVGLTDLWAFSPATSTWRLVVPSCSGAGCPVTTGFERLVPVGPSGRVAVVADPYGPAGSDSSWTLDDGSWASRAEARSVPGRDDCNLDGLRDAGWGARCDVGGHGFPAYGRLRCDPATGDLACRAPVVPAQALVEFLMPGNGPVVPVPGGVAVLQDRTLDIYGLDGAGVLTPRRTIRLSRPGNDVAADQGFAYVADRQGLTVYSMADGAQVAAVATCGKARRVFVEGSIVYVLGLRSILVVDVGEPRAPVVLGDLRIAAGLGSAWLAPADRCGPTYRVADALCDLSGVCGLTGRVAAAEAGHRLFVNLLDSTYEIDFTAGVMPVLSPPLRTGLAMRLASEDSVLYVNGAGCGRAMYERDEDGMWLYGGPHDVGDWVVGVVSTGSVTLRRTPGRLAISQRQ
ncbi:MAG: hypothetical protein HY905_06120 [Deltaproteobacteria bacterium]|nr:hypothetical protein [Deltaproteobacteria bacterium]